MWQKTLFQRVTRVAFQHTSEGIGHGDRTEDAGFGLHSEIGEREFDRLGNVAGPAESAVAMSTGGNGEILVGDLFQFGVGRMIDDFVYALAALIILFQLPALPD